MHWLGIVTIKAIPKHFRYAIIAKLWLLKKMFIPFRVFGRFPADIIMAISLPICDRWCARFVNLGVGKSGGRWADGKLDFKYQHDFCKGIKKDFPRKLKKSFFNPFLSSSSRSNWSSNRYWWTNSCKMAVMILCTSIYGSSCPSTCSGEAVSFSPTTDGRPDTSISS